MGGQVASNRNPRKALLAPNVRARTRARRGRGYRCIPIQPARLRGAHVPVV